MIKLLLKRISNLLLSSPTMIFLLVALMFSMGAATFIEDKYDTMTAQNLVYHAWWFELIFFLLIVNLFGHISKFKMVSRKMWAEILFHVAFIVIILGAGITRYFGFEGTMHIREGQESSIIYTQEPWLQIALQDEKFSYDQPFSISNFFSGLRCNY